MKSRVSTPRLPVAFVMSIALLLCVARSHAAGAPIPHGTVELVSENQWIAPEHESYLGLHFELEKGWHIYWVNPGDSGEPPRVTWQLPTGVTLGEVQWPTPHRLGTSSIVDFGYEDAVTLIVPVHAEARLGAKSLAQAQLEAQVKVLVCREMCIPGKAQVSLTLPVESSTPSPDAKTRDLFAAARKSLPRSAPRNWKFSVANTKDFFALEANLGERIKAATFFPLAEAQIDNAAPQKLVPEASGFRLTLRKSDRLLQPIERLKGILVLSGRGYWVDALVGKPAAKGNYGAAEKAGDGARQVQDGNLPGTKSKEEPQK